MHSERTALDLIGHIYDAAADPSLWPAFLELLSQHQRSSIGTFYAWNSCGPRTDVAAVVGLDERSLRLHDEYYGAKNIFLLRGARLLQPGTIRASQELCPDDEMKRSEYYNDFMAPRLYK